MLTILLIVGLLYLGISFLLIGIEASVTLISDGIASVVVPGIFLVLSVSLFTFIGYIIAKT